MFGGFAPMSPSGHCPGHQAAILLVLPKIDAPTFFLYYPLIGEDHLHII